MYNKKQWTVLVSLLLIGQENYKWHGYQIKKQIKETYKLDNENVFPVLRELLKEGYIKSKEVIDDNNRPRKHYRLTEEGEKLIDEFRSHNQRVETLFSVYDSHKCIKEW